MNEIKASVDFLESIHSRTSKARVSTSAASSLGQWIGLVISTGTTLIWSEIVAKHQGYKLLRPEKGQKRTYLQNTLGQKKEIDDIICNDKNEPILISESKWLKDARHLNDKGAWVALMSEVKQQNTSVKGAVSILAGPWDAGGNSEALNNVVQTILIPTNDVYRLLEEQGIKIEINTVRNMYEKPEIPLAKYMDLIDQYAANGVDLIATLGNELVGRYKTLMESAFERIIALPDNMEFIDINDVSEITVTYKTKDGDFREIFTDLVEAKNSLKNKINPR